MARSKTDSGRPRLKDYESPHQLRSMFVHQLQNRLCEQTPREGRESDQDHARRIHAAGEDEPSEILVLCQKYAVLDQRKAQHLLVHGALLKLTHREHIMAVFPESTNHREIAAFIREEAHGMDLLRTKSQDGFVRDRVGRVGQCRPNVFRG